MLFKYDSEEFLTLVTKIKNLVEFEIASYSVTSTLQQTNFRHTLIMNLKLILELNNDGELIIIDNIPLAFHKKERVSLNHLISTQVVDVINYNNVNQISDEEIEALNIAFFADFYEYILFYNTNTYGNKFNTFVRIVINNYSQFSKENFNELARLMAIIPSLGFREIISSEDFKSIKLIQDTESKIAESLKKAENLKKEVNLLDEKLAKQKTEFNFIGLSDGFNSLRKQKVKELNGERGVYWILMLSIIGLIIYKLYWTVNYLNEPNPNLQLLIVVSISFVLMLLVVIYFFRISLVNIKSIRSQILQIDLRLTLCQFIHNYQNDTSGFRNAEIKDSLDKFEAVIFSPIVATDDKIPTTFEGIEQLSGLIGLINKKTP